VTKEKIQIKRPKIDHRVAAYVFIGTIIFMFLIDLLVGWSGVDRTDFWEASVAVIIRYVALFGLFFIVCKQLRFTSKEIPQAIGLNKRVTPNNFFMVVLIFAIILVGFALLHQGFSDLLVSLGYSPGSGPEPSGVPQYIMAVVVLAFLPAVVEELLFRGLILKGLLPMGKWVAVFASAALFSIFHVNPEQTILQFIMGVVYAIVVLKTGNLLYGMILHFLHNFAVITTYTFFGDFMSQLAWNPVWVVRAVGLAVLGALMLWGLLKMLKPQGECPKFPKTQRFWALDNFGYYIAFAFAGVFWISILLIRFGIG